MKKKILFIGGIIVIIVLFLTLIIDTPSSAYDKVMVSIKNNDKIVATARYSYQEDTEVMIDGEIQEDYTIEITDSIVIKDIIEILIKSKYEMLLSDVVTVVSDSDAIFGYDMEFYNNDKFITSITIKSTEIDTSKYVGTYNSDQDFETLKELIESQNIA